MKKSTIKGVLCSISMLSMFVSTVSVFVGLAMKNFDLCLSSIIVGYVSLMLFFSFVFGIKDEEKSNG